MVIVMHCVDKFPAPAARRAGAATVVNSGCGKLNDLGLPCGDHGRDSGMFRAEAHSGRGFNANACVNIAFIRQDCGRDCSGSRHPGNFLLVKHPLGAGQ